MNSIENQQLLTTLVLEDALNDRYEWRAQGLGMLQLYLSPATRLHIWHSSLRDPKATRIHNHPWHFNSLVLAGSITNFKWIVGHNPSDRDAARQPYWEGSLFCGVGGGLEGEPTPCWLIPWHPDGHGVRYLAGTDYSQNPEEVHHTEFEDGTVTLCTRRVPEGRSPDMAKVYWPWDQSFGAAEPRPATREEILRVGQAALGLIIP